MRKIEDTLQRNQPYASQSQLKIFRDSVEYETRQQQRSLENYERHEQARAKF